MLGFDIRHKNRGQDDARNAHWQIDEKDPAPMQIGGEKTANQGADNGADQRWQCEIGKRLDQFAFRYRAHQNEAAYRHHHRPTHALHGTRDDKTLQRVGEGAGQRGKGEYGNCQPKHLTRAEAIGHLAADRDEDGEAKQVGGEGEFEDDGVLMKIQRDGWKGRGQNG